MASQIKASYMDVLSEIDGGACLLSVVLYKKGLMTHDQYYSIRSKYCFKKFNEEYGGIASTPDGQVPRSIVEYWNKCDAMLHKVILEKSIRFVTCSIPVKIFRMDDEEKAHAIGKVGDVDCFFELVFGSQLKKKHKVDALKKLESYALASGLTLRTSGRKVFCLVLGLHDEEADASKVLREVEMEDVMTKTTNAIKTEGWLKITDAFGTAKIKIESDLQRIEGKDYLEIPTNPSDCGLCPFHNHAFKIQKAGGTAVKYVCSGYIHAVP